MTPTDRPMTTIGHDRRRRRWSTTTHDDDDEEERSTDRCRRRRRPTTTTMTDDDDDDRRPLPTTKMTMTNDMYTLVEVNDRFNPEHLFHNTGKRSHMLDSEIFIWYLNVVVREAGFIPCFACSLLLTSCSCCVATVCVYGACGNESSVAELPAPQISSLGAVFFCGSPPVPSLQALDAAGLLSTSHAHTTTYTP
jgi:hypothetical protein